MERYRFLFNEENCIGCKACQIACKDKNHLKSGEYIRIAKQVEETQKDGEKTRFISYSYPFQERDSEWLLPLLKSCSSCRDLREQGLNPACVDACVTKCLTWREVQ